jgi:tryptophanyl-tRNA synthetase
MSQGRLLSAVRASGELHLGNYLGTMRQWVAVQAEKDCFYFIADLHGLTHLNAEYSPAAFAEARLRTVAAYLAAGLDPARVTLFLQSAVPQHLELMWYLSTVATKGELERVVREEKKLALDAAGASASLFYSPVLMASDIILYEAEEVPVGDDQREQVEIACDWAKRFNSRFDTEFAIPRALVPATAARIMDLQRPSSKMSKSGGTQGTLFISDTPDQLYAKIRRAVTDRGRHIIKSREKPGISNLIEIYSAITELTATEIQDEFLGRSYSDLKEALAEVVVSTLGPIREKMLEYLSDPSLLAEILRSGAQKAQEIAEGTTSQARVALGIRPVFR